MEKVIIFSIFGFLFSLIGTKYLKEYLEKKKIFDFPNERSNHSKPVPTGGGWIINLCILDHVIFRRAGCNPKHLIVSNCIIKIKKYKLILTPVLFKVFPKHP